MHNIERIITLASINIELLLLVGLLAAMAIGKSRQYLNVLSRVQHAADDMKLFMRHESDPLRLSNQLKKPLNFLTNDTPLTETAAQSIIEIDSENGRARVDKKNLALALLQSGDGRKAQRKIKKFWKKVF